MIGTTHTLDILDESDIVAARQLARNIAREIGLGPVDQIRVATSISELARNIVRYAGQGRITLTVVASGSRTGIEIICSDDGPGIANLDEILEGGYASDQGLGLGLTGTRRLMDEFDVDTEVGRGTTITVRKWL